MFTGMRTDAKWMMGIGAIGIVFAVVFWAVTKMPAPLSLPVWVLGIGGVGAALLGIGYISAKD